MTAFFETAEFQYGVSKAYSALPSILPRTAFFVAIVYRGRVVRPAFATPTLIGSLPMAGGVAEIYQTAGVRLDEHDCDVYLELVRRAVHQQMGEHDTYRLTIDAEEFLPSINRDRGANYLKWLGESLSRLKRASFLVTIPPTKHDRIGLEKFEISLVIRLEGWRNNRKSGGRYYTLVLDSKMAQVFACVGKTLIDMRVRRALVGDVVAKALHAFYSSHDHTRFVALSTIRRVLGRTDQSDKVFARDVLKPALANLKEATDWHHVHFNDKRNGIELYFTEKARQEAQGHCKSSDAASSVRHERARQAFIPPVSVELESWLKVQSVVRLEEIVNAYGVAEQGLSQAALENTIRELYLDGATINAFNRVETCDTDI